MNNSDRQLDRLLRAAAEAPDGQPNEIPYGFETRVLARWRAGLKPELVAVGLLLRRVILLSLGVIVLASAGAYRELVQGDDAEGFADEYAIADSAIGSAIEP